MKMERMCLKFRFVNVSTNTRRSTNRDFAKGIALARVAKAGAVFFLEIRCTGNIRS